MSIFRKDRRAFRPSLGTDTLEDRVVMSAGVSSRMAAISAAANPMAVGVTQREAQQTFLEYVRQLRVTNQVLKNYVQAQSQLLYQNGMPTAEQRAAFQANVGGAINAAALNLASQSQLLPNAARLSANIQNSLLGSNPASLNSRINAFLGTRGSTGANVGQLTNSINRLIDSSLGAQQQYYGTYFRSTPLNRLTVDQTGNRIGLQQYMGQQAINQFNNTIGSLVNNAGALANSTLYANGGTPDLAAINGFQRQYGNALNTAVGQLGNNLSLFRNNNPDLLRQINSGFFNNTVDQTTGLPVNSFINGTSALFNTNTGIPSQADFTTAFQNAIGNAYNTVAGPLYNNFGLTPTYNPNGNVALPTGTFQNGATFPGVFNQSYLGNNFNNGFNNGFATNPGGFPGFGTSPTGFNSNFGTGFNNYTSTLNQNLLFSGQPYSVGGTFGGGGGLI